MAGDLDIDQSVLRHRKKRLEEGRERPFPGKSNPPDEDMAQLQRGNARLKSEVRLVDYHEAIDKIAFDPEKDFH